MQLVLKNPIKTAKSTISELYIDGKFECHILEDTIRLIKKYGETAIPAGEYTIAVTYSPRFQKALPLLLNVPGYAGIRVHPGNKSADTEGCLLPGMYKKTTPDWVSGSKIAFDALFSKINKAIKKEKVTITIQR